LMGPNGSGKTSLAYAIAGHPSYVVTSGTARLGHADLVALKPEERAAAGLFLSFQEPPEVGGVSMQTFLTTIADAPMTQDAFGPLLAQLRIDASFLTRFLNDGFSGGEKKKSELLQCIARRPKIAILDEIDAGLDVDALTAVVEMLREAVARGAGLLVISHSPRLFRMMAPDRVMVLGCGRITGQGGSELLDTIEERGYGAFG